MGEARRTRLDAGEDGEHVGMGARGARVQRDDLRMGAVGAQKKAMDLAGQRHVRRVTPAPRDEPRILAPAPERLAHSRPLRCKTAAQGAAV